MNRPGSRFAAVRVRVHVQVKKIERQGNEEISMIVLLFTPFPLFFHSHFYLHLYLPSHFSLICDNIGRI